MSDRPPYLALYEPEVHRNPGEVYARMRSMYGPVIPVALEPGIYGWMIIHYETIVAWCRDTQTFRRDSRLWRALSEGEVPADAGVLSVMRPRPTLMFADGDDHQRLRGAVVDSLAKLDSREIARHTQRAADALIDLFCARGDAELLDEYARVLPMLVCSKLCGYDDDSGHRFMVAFRDFWDGVDSARADAEMERVESAVVAEKSARPGQDIASWLIQHPAGLTEAEVRDELRVVFGAGNDPTANLIGNAMRVLLTDRALGQEVVGAQISIEDAIEQVMWTAPPISSYPVMYATVDVRLGNGMTLPKGSPILLGYGAANRFAAEEHGDRMASVVNRAHLSWGVGPHRCPARSIATVIAVTAIETLIRRLPGLRLGIDPADLEWRVSPFSRSLTRLPVAFPPAHPLDVPEPVHSGAQRGEQRCPVSGDGAALRQGHPDAPRAAEKSGRSLFAYLADVLFRRS